MNMNVKIYLDLLSLRIYEPQNLTELSSVIRKAVYSNTQ